MKTKKFIIAVCMGLMVSILVSMARFDASCVEIKENILRLHVLANSDSEEDQALKLKIRDRILEVGADAFEDQETLILAEQKAKEMLPIFTEEAKKVIKQNGFNYDVKVSLSKAYFETRVYENFTLPAGEYNALKVVIGEGKGKNWWCVIFPSVCLPTATKQNLGGYVSNSSQEITDNAPKYRIKFKVVEWYESIKNGLFK